jgi:predicted  nucleic acid-binding Zn-ribbon protein
VAEPTKPEMGWSFSALAEHLSSVTETLLREVDKRYEQRFKQQEKATDTAFIAQEKAIQAALAAAKEAVTKAENAVEKRFDNTNEWRGAMQDRDRDLMPRKEIEQRFDSVRVQQNWILGVMVTLLLGVATLIVTILRH